MTGNPIWPAKATSAGVPDPGRGRQLAVYRAEARAAARVPAAALPGDLAAAQAYVDRITRSVWWRRTCPPSWLGDHCDSRHLVDDSQPPRRVIVVAHRGIAGYARHALFRHRGRWYPQIRLGTRDAVHNELPALADPWVILHELAHIMCLGDGTDRGHGRGFARRMLQLVRRWLGADSAAVLAEEYRRENVKSRARPGRRL